LVYKIELIEFSSFAVEIRYPGTEATAEEAEKCLLLAENIMKITKRYLCEL
jgi:HEPN domain-containing protein